ncbi:DNAH6, partial [Symbiodinium pilosum]
MPAVARSEKERTWVHSYFQKLVAEGSPWLQTPRQAPSAALRNGATSGRQTSQKEKSQLRQALRNRGGAAEVANSNPSASPARCLRKDVKEAASQGRTSSIGTSRDRRPSWAPSATSMVEGAVEHFSRMVEAVRTAGPEISPPVPHADQLCQSLQKQLSDQLSNWFIAFSQRYDGRIPPRLTSLVQRGEMDKARLQTTLVWRGLEVHLELQLTPGSKSVAVSDAWTEVLSDGFADCLSSALASARGQPLEVLLEALLD